MQVKQDKIVKMFDDIAPTYDKLNRILSFGVDKSWRKKAIKEVLKNAPQSVKIADIACGTGDMIALWQDLAHKTVQIVGVDPSEQMLDIGARRLHTVIEKLLEDLSFEADKFAGKKFVVDKKMVEEKLGDIIENKDLARYIL